MRSRELAPHEKRIARTFFKNFSFFRRADLAQSPRIVYSDGHMRVTSFHDQNMSMLNINELPDDPVLLKRLLTERDALLAERDELIGQISPRGDRADGAARSTAQGGDGCLAAALLWAAMREVRSASVAPVRHDGRGSFARHGEHRGRVGRAARNASRPAPSQARTAAVARGARTDRDRARPDRRRAIVSRVRHRARTDRSRSERAARILSRRFQGFAARAP